jgi:hypothetical protein
MPAIPRPRPAEPDAVTRVSPVPRQSPSGPADARSGKLGLGRLISRRRAPYSLTLGAELDRDVADVTESDLDS